jgi:hypothetical protein
LVKEKVGLNRQVDLEERAPVPTHYWSPKNVEVMVSGAFFSFV